MDAYWRAANNLSVGQIFLADHPLLKRPLAITDVKHMLLGHWGTITTPFDMTVLNDLDRFHLVMDTVDRLPQTGDKGLALKELLKAKLIEHKCYIDENGQDMPEIRSWKWGASHDL